MDARDAPFDADCVVVGASFGGLASAHALASAGLRVAVVEKKTDPGGKLHSTGIIVKDAVDQVALLDSLPSTLVRRVPGVRAARVLILGGGVVGTEAARMAAGLGANVAILDLDLERLRYLDQILPRNVRTLYSTPYTIREELATADLVVGAVLIHGAAAPKLVRREDLKLLRRGSVIVDVAIDQGGCAETSRPTTHDDPVYTVDGVVHYCVANMPGAVPITSTRALTNVTLPYVEEIADHGVLDAIRRDPELAPGVNVIGGRITYEAVAEAHGLEYTPLDDALAAGVA